MKTLTFWGETIPRATIERLQADGLLERDA
jgi:hypothetical protein